MGKKQHSKDRLYLTTKEWKEEWGGHRGPAEVPFTKLPFYCCAICFTPFEDAVCTEDGCVFDITNAVPYIQKHKRHPVTGNPLSLKDLIQLKFHKNADGQYHCPVMNKVFTEHTHIVAVKTTGNVYCFEAVNELNIKPKNWKDLLTEERFTRKDIIHIQDPLNFQHKVVKEFDHLKKNLTAGEAPKDESVFRNVSSDTQRVLESLGTSDSEAAFQQGGGGKSAQARQYLALIKSEKKNGDSGKDGSGQEKKGKGKKRVEGPSGTCGSIDWRLQPPERARPVPFKPGANTWDTDDYTEQEESRKKRKKAENDASLKKPKEFDPNGGKMDPQAAYDKNFKYETAMRTTGHMSRGFTSTVMNPTTVNERVLIRQDRNPKQKGYLKLHTNLGDLNIELRCDVAPRACENFIALCKMGYYNGLAFHRSIKNFMIQGGDPTGTGRGGTSIYGPTFKDELDSRLSHSGRGIVSMANSGPHTNGSQFFILYKSAKHLDLKHTVFGMVVGGFEVLSAMEKVETDEEDRPNEDIKIVGVTVYVDPYEEMREAERKLEEEKEKKVQQEDEGSAKGLWYSDPGAMNRTEKTPGNSSSCGGGVGKYLKLPESKTSRMLDMAFGNEVKEVKIVPKKVTQQKKGYGNFDGW